MASKIGNSFLTISDLTTIGLSKAVMPTTSVMLVIFEPNALPRASPQLPWTAAKTDTMISGADVPNPMINIPINNGGMPNDLR